MPWSRKDASKHTKKANTPKKQALWRSVANDALHRGHSEGVAIRMANSAVKGKSKARHRKARND